MKELYTQTEELVQSGKKETNKEINSESMQKIILSQKHTWDLFANIENIYERFIKNHSARTLDAQWHNV